jgi:hypothetical protein
MLIVMMRWRSHPRRQAATVETGEVGGTPRKCGAPGFTLHRCRLQKSSRSCVDFVESPSPCAVFLRLGQRNEGI